jgi:hypothetical protein
MSYVDRLVLKLLWHCHWININNCHLRNLKITIPRVLLEIALPRRINSPLDSISKESEL